MMRSRGYMLLLGGGHFMPAHPTVSYSRLFEVGSGSICFFFLEFMLWQTKLLMSNEYESLGVFSQYINTRCSNNIYLKTIYTTNVHVTASIHFTAFQHRPTEVEVVLEVDVACCVQDDLICDQC